VVDFRFTPDCPVGYIEKVGNFRTQLCVGLWFALAFFASSAWGGTSDPPRLAPPRANPLRRAAEEFKVLTRQRGMRPGSPPSLQLSRRRKFPWHGRVYENFRNDVLDAIPHEVKQNGGNKSPLRRNQFGFNVGGPLLIPHLIENPQSTFFMLSYEGVREHIFHSSLHTVPTAAERQGDFSQTVDSAGHPLPIYDPAATTPNPAYNPDLPVSPINLEYLRSTFPDNVIPASRLSPQAVQLLSLYPLPNTDVGPFFENNYFVNAPETDAADGMIAKVNHSFGNRHQLSALVTISKGLLAPAQYFPNLASPTAPPQHFSSRRAELDYVSTPNSRTSNSASLAVGSSVERAGGGSQSAFPRYQFGPYLSMGAAFPNSRSARNTLEVRDEISTREGKHTPHLTLQFDHDQVNSYDPAYPSGEFQFSSGLTGLPGIIDTGNPFASFLLGLPDYAERTLVTAPSYFRDSYQSIAAGDKYQVTNDLTLHGSVNLSRRTPRVEKYNRQSAVDPAVIDPSNGLPGALIFAGRNGVPRGLRAANIDLDFGLGLAWNPRGDSKTVLRASYSRDHGRIPIYNGQWSTQGFNARQTFVSPNTELSPALELSAGIPPPSIPLPDLSPSAADNTVADFMDLSGREPVYQRASLSVERKLPFSMTVSVGTNYDYGRDVLVGDGNANPNAINPSNLSYGNALYNEAFRVTLQPYPQFKGFELYGLYPAGRYQRNAGFLRVEKRASFGLSVTADYVISRELDDYSGPYGNQNFFNWRDNWSLTSWNPPQFLQLSYIYRLPFGPNQALLRFPGWASRVVSGWSVSGMGYWNDGRPLALHPEFNQTGGVLSTLYVNVVPGADPQVAHPGPAEWFNPAAFAQPPDFTLGDGSRTEAALLGPGFNSLDLSLDKRMPVGGDRAIEFTATAFNFLNHGNWNYPDTVIGPASAPNVDAGRIIDSSGGRVIQLGLTFSY
jgi:hypothetical protein